MPISISSVEKILRNWEIPVTDKMANYLRLPRVIVDGNTISDALNSLNEIRLKKSYRFSCLNIATPEDVAEFIAIKFGYEVSRVMCSWEFLNKENSPMYSDLYHRWNGGK